MPRAAVNMAGVRAAKRETAALGLGGGAAVDGPPVDGPLLMAGPLAVSRLVTSRVAEARRISFLVAGPVVGPDVAAAGGAVAARVAAADVGQTAA